MSKKRMVCADCGIEMNHHAEKICFGAAPASAAAVDPDLGGIVEEAHSCPGCGKTEMRIASE